MLLKIFQFATGKHTNILGVKALLALKLTCIRFYNIIEDYQSAFVISSIDLHEKDLMIEKTSMMSSLKKTLRVGERKYKTNEPLLTMLEKYGTNEIRLVKGTLDTKDNTNSVPSLLCRKRESELFIRTLIHEKNYKKL